MASNLPYRSGSTFSAYKLDPFFFPAADWTITTPATTKHSGLVYRELFSNLPATRLHHFINNPDYLGKGFEMLTKLLSPVLAAHNKCMKARKNHTRSRCS